MKALLLIAHGSRNPEFNVEIRDLTRSLETLVNDSMDSQFDLVQCAFLELTEPDIETGLIQLIKQGAVEITVLPYFLAKGNHVLRDIPEIITAAQSRFPGIAIDVIPHIGKAGNMGNLLIEHLLDSRK